MQRVCGGEKEVMCYMFYTCQPCCISFVTSVSLYNVPPLPASISLMSEVLKRNCTVVWQAHSVSVNV